MNIHEMMIARYVMQGRIDLARETALEYAAERDSRPTSAELEAGYTALLSK